MKRFAALLLSALLAASSVLCAASAPRPIFVLTDPVGDDHGDGSLIYPQRDDMRSGDLDLVSLAAFEDPEGTLFEATFNRTITKPDPARQIDDIGLKLVDVAKLGFYTFNIDVYIDTDRVAGSGRTQMLPGRRAEVDPASAWEKVICLTPNPPRARDTLRSILKARETRQLKAEKGKVLADDAQAVRQAVSREIEANVFFPTRVTVLGRTVKFVVPVTFLGGRAKAEWGYVVSVTGADLAQKVDLGSALGVADPDPDRLMMLPVGTGAYPDRFGTKHDWDPLMPALVDVVVPAGQKQEEVLGSYDPRSQKPARLQAVVPASGPAPGAKP